MILAATIAVSLLVPVAVDRYELAPNDVPSRSQALPLWRKNAAIRPLVTSATECIVRTVSADPRLPESVKSAALNELIVDSVPSCLVPLRAMIDAYDRWFGDGTGEEFFMGPYLDSLPGLVGSKIAR